MIILILPRSQCQIQRSNNMDIIRHYTVPTMEQIGSTSTYLRPIANIYVYVLIWGKVKFSRLRRLEVIIVVMCAHGRGLKRRRHIHCYSGSRLTALPYIMRDRNYMRVITSYCMYSRRERTCSISEPS